MDSTGAPGVGVPDDDAQDDRALMGSVSAHAALGSLGSFLPMGLLMPRAGKTLIEPVAFTKREATVLIDLARDRLASMKVIDREDVDTQVSIVGAVRKLESVSHEQRTANGRSETGESNCNHQDRSK